MNLIWFQLASMISLVLNTRTIAGQLSTPSNYLTLESESINVPRNELFYHRLRTNHSDWKCKNKSNAYAVTYMASLLDEPDLPPGISIYQSLSGPSRDAWLYGTIPYINHENDDADNNSEDSLSNPEQRNSNDVITIDVVAINMVCYELQHRVYHLKLNRTTVDSGDMEKQTQFQVIMQLLNIDLDQFFEQNKASTVKQIFEHHLWPGARIVDVSSTSLTSTMHSIEIKLNNTKPYNERLLRLDAEAQRMHNRCPAKKSKALSAHHYFRAQHLFPNWCKFKLVNS